jgi:RNA polymerase sigma factor (TIGR02999 family)
MANEEGEAVSGEVTAWLERWRGGDRAALDHLVPLLYTDLRQLARRSLRRERSEHTLSTTALVHEAYLRLLGQRQIQASDRAGFLAVAGYTMRRVLVDYARGRKRAKRGGGKTPVSLDQAELDELEGAAPFLTSEQAEEVLALDSALERLAAISPRGAEVIQHRFFAGLTLEETADVLQVSVKTVQRDWLAARAWLRKEIRRDLALDVENAAAPTRPD